MKKTKKSILKAFVSTTIAFAMVFSPQVDKLNLSDLSITASAVTYENPLKLPAPTNILAKKSNTAVRLTWDEVKNDDIADTISNFSEFSWADNYAGVVGYRVFKYDDKTKKYKKYKDVISPTCLIDNLNPGQEYKFKIAAIADIYDTLYHYRNRNLGENYKPLKSDVIQEQSKAISVTTKTTKGSEDLSDPFEIKYSNPKKLAAPTGISIDKTSTTIEISWDKAENAYIADTSSDNSKATIYAVVPTSVSSSFRADMTPNRHS